jgi:hypothetical protein
MAGPEGQQGPEGPQGPEGEEGPAGAGIKVVVVITARGGAGEPADAICPKGAPLAISGGGAVEDKGGTLDVSAPLSHHELASEGHRPDGWRVISAADRYTAYAICTSVAGKGEEAPEETEEEAEETKANEIAEKEHEATVGK